MELANERDKIAHLLRRFGLGASEAELAYYSQRGLRGAIDALLNYEQTDEGFDVPVTKFKQGAKDRLKIAGIQGWWVLRLLATRRPFQEKMTLFWHDHFATSAAKVVQPLLMYQQNEVLRQFAVGRFQDLLMAVSKDPAMLLWLDNEYNLKGKPNENFAREVMELFTLGIGHYTEKDIQESARAFTGWSIRRVKQDEQEFGARARGAVFQLRQALHDDGEKSFMGNRGNFDGDDIIGILCGNPQTARFLVRKIWTWFVYPDPSDALVNRFAEDFHSHGMDIKRLVRSIAESEEFYSDRAYRAVYKNPVDFVIAPMRQLGIGAQIVTAIKDDETVSGLTRATIAAAQQALKSMGMALLFPPDVSGWDAGAAWVTTATMIERIQFGEALYAQSPPGGGRAQIHYDIYPVLSKLKSPIEVVRMLLSIYDVRVGDSQMHLLADEAMKIAQGSVTEENANQIAAHVSRLVFGCPQFQFC
jgi:uncharacterized protein (DUF1800 family)